ncbi:hypothetical protein CR513_04178, partial [Mucuna pruriens]
MWVNVNYTVKHASWPKALDFSIPLQALCIFLRYVTHNKGYRYYDPIGKCHYTTMDATFLEFESYYSLATILYLQRLTWNKDLKWWDCIIRSEVSPKSKDSPIGIIEHGKATRETTYTRIALQVEIDLIALQAETNPIQFDEAEHGCYPSL